MQATTTNDKRQRRIAQGSKEGATLAARADGKEAIRDIRRDLKLSPHLDTGASSIDDIQAREAAKASMAGDTYTEPDETSAATFGLPRHHPALDVPMTALLDDVRRSVKRFTRGYSKDERIDIATDAVLILLRWSTQGAKAPFYLGPPNAAPMRRYWYDAERRTVIRDGKSSRPAPCDGARRAMRAAILQAANARNSDAASALARRAAELESASVDDERESVQTTLAQAALRMSEASAARAPSLPDTDAPELLADAMGVTLTEARTLVAQAWRIQESPDRCAELWQVSAQRAKQILSDGKKQIHARYPDSGELLDALADAAPALRERMATSAYQALTALRDAAPWEDKARLARRADKAVSEWRAAMEAPPMERRAIELAARRVAWEPEYIRPAAHLSRLMAATWRQAETSATACEHGSHLPMTRTALDARTVARAASLAPVSRWRLLPLADDPTSASRSALYARCAADERSRSNVE